jgi:signal transduction histidine kinase
MADPSVSDGEPTAWAAREGAGPWSHLALQRPAFETIQFTEDEADVCTAVLIGLDDLRYPNAMISFLETVRGERMIIADPKYAIGTWERIAPKTRRSYDHPTDLLPLVLRRGKSRYIADSRRDPAGENDAPLCEQMGLISQYAIPLLTSTLEIGTLQIDLGDRRGEPPARKELMLLDAVAAHLSIGIERCRLIHRAGALEEETSQHSQLLAFGTVATGTIHGFRKEMKNFLRDLEDGMGRSSLRSNKDALAFLRQTRTRAEDWLGRVEECIRATQPSVLPVEAVISNSVARLRDEWAERLRSLRLEDHSRGAKVRVWAQLLDEVLRNLVVNAVEAKARNITVSMHVEACRDDATGAMVQIVVRDDGEGIPDLLRETVQRFGFTTKHRFGTGLGLPVSELLMARMYGKLVLLSGGRSAGEEYTEFALSLPVASE